MLSRRPRRVVKFTMMLTKREMRALQREAARRDVTMSELLRAALRSALDGTHQ